MQERIHQGAAIALVLGSARAGMHHHAGGFINDGKIVIFINDVRRNFAPSDFLENRHVTSVSLPHRTIKPCPIGDAGQFLANKADDFFTQRVAAARPCFGAAEMLHTKL